MLQLGSGEFWKTTSENIPGAGLELSGYLLNLKTNPVSEAAGLSFQKINILPPPPFRNFFLNREVNSGFFYKSAEEREKLVKAERKFIEDRVKKIIELKKKVCGDSDKGFVVINQKVRMK